MHGSDICNPNNGPNNSPVLQVGTDFDGISDSVRPVLLQNKTLSQSYESCGKSRGTGATCSC